MGDNKQDFHMFEGDFNFEGGAGDSPLLDPTSQTNTNEGYQTPMGHSPHSDLDDSPHTVHEENLPNEEESSLSSVHEGSTHTVPNANTGENGGEGSSNVHDEGQQNQEVAEVHNEGQQNQEVAEVHNEGQQNQEVAEEPLIPENLFQSSSHSSPKNVSSSVKEKGTEITTEENTQDNTRTVSFGELRPSAYFHGVFDTHMRSSFSQSAQGRSLFDQTPMTDDEYKGFSSSLFASLGPTKRIASKEDPSKSVYFTPTKKVHPEHKSGSSLFRTGYQTSFQAIPEEHNSSQVKPGGPTSSQLKKTVDMFSSLMLDEALPYNEFSVVYITNPDDRNVFLEDWMFHNIEQSNIMQSSSYIKLRLEEERKLEIEAILAYPSIEETLENNESFRLYCQKIISEFELKFPNKMITSELQDSLLKDARNAFIGSFTYEEMQLQHDLKIKPKRVYFVETRLLAWDTLELRKLNKDAENFEPVLLNKSVSFNEAEQTLLTKKKLDKIFMQNRCLKIQSLVNNFNKTDIVKTMFQVYFNEMSEGEFNKFKGESSNTSKTDMELEELFQAKQKEFVTKQKANYWLKLMAYLGQELATWYRDGFGMDHQNSTGQSLPDWLGAKSVFDYNKFQQIADSSLLPEIKIQNLPSQNKDYWFTEKKWDLPSIVSFGKKILDVKDQPSQVVNNILSFMMLFLEDTYFKTNFDNVLRVQYDAFLNPDFRRFHEFLILRKDKTFTFKNYPVPTALKNIPTKYVNEDFTLLRYASLHLHTSKALLLLLELVLKQNETSFNSAFTIPARNDIKRVMAKRELTLVSGQARFNESNYVKFLNDHQTNSNAVGVTQELQYLSGRNDIAQFSMFRFDLIPDVLNWPKGEGDSRMLASAKKGAVYLWGGALTSRTILEESIQNKSSLFTDPKASQEKKADDSKWKEEIISIKEFCARSNDVFLPLGIHVTIYEKYFGTQQKRERPMGCQVNCGFSSNIALNDKQEELLVSLDDINENKLSPKAHFFDAKTTPNQTYTMKDNFLNKMKNVSTTSKVFLSAMLELQCTIVPEPQVDLIDWDMDTEEATIFFHMKFKKMSKQLAIIYLMINHSHALSRLSLKNQIKNIMQTYQDENYRRTVLNFLNDCNLTEEVNEFIGGNV